MGQSFHLSFMLCLFQRIPASHNDKKQAREEHSTSFLVNTGEAAGIQASHDLILNYQNKQHRVKITGPVTFCVILNKLFFLYMHIYALLV